MLNIKINKDEVDEKEEILNKLSLTSQLIYKLMHSLGLFDKIFLLLDDAMSNSLKIVLSKDLKHITEVEQEQIDSKLNAFYSDFTEILNTIVKFNVQNYK